MYPAQYDPPGGTNFLIAINFTERHLLDYETILQIRIRFDMQKENFNGRVEEEIR
jgi:hypothetical protein